MIYIIDEIDKLNNSFVKNYWNALSTQRQIKIQKYPFEEKKIQSIAVYLLLRIALTKEYNIDEPVEFDFLTNGKPVLPEYPHIHFNLSHCKTAVACAVSTSPVGIDIEHIKPVSDKVTGRILTQQEFSQFKLAPDPNEFFCKIWTIKESYQKLSGDGLRADFREISADSITDKTLYEGKNYFCCACGLGTNETKIMIRKIGRESFEQFYG